MRLYIILSDEHRRRYLRLNASRLRNAHVMAHFFLVFSFLFFFLLLFLSFLYLSRKPSTDLDRHSRLRFSISFQDAIRTTLPCAAVEKVNERIRFRITRFCSSLGTISHNGSDGRTLPHGLFFPSPAFHPQPPHPRATSLYRDLRPLRFNLTRHYYVFHHDSSLR